MLYKKVTKSGAITIPQQLRHQLGITSGMPLAIAITEDGLHISKYVQTCMLCGSPENVAIVNNFEICSACAAEALRRIENGNARSKS